MPAPLAIGQIETYLEQRLPGIIEPQQPHLPHIDQRVPMKVDLDPGVETVKQIIVEESGNAELRDGTARDLPISSAVYYDRDRPVRGIWTAVRFSYNEMRRNDLAVKNGAIDLVDRKLGVAGRALSEAENKIAAWGKGSAGFDGFVNHPEVTPNDIDTVNIFNPETTSVQIFRHFLEMFRSVRYATSLVVSDNIFAVLASPRSETDKTTVAQMLLENLRIKGLREIVTDYELDGQELMANGVREDTDRDRVVIYQKNPAVIERHVELPQRAPVEQRDGVTIIPLFKCITPILVQHPESIGYFDIPNRAA